ncbi:MAG: adenosine deaminase [Planctomycetota bacterium]
MRISEDLAARLPKTDLHLHLDGSLRLATVRELAAERKIRLPAHDPQALQRFLQVGLECQSLEEYLRVFDVTLPLLQDAQALTRVAFELAEDAHRENVLYAEIRYSPLLHRDGGLGMDQVVAAVEEGLSRARDRYGIRCGQILCGIRHISPDSSMELAELAVRWKDRGVVGFDLAGAERDYPAKEHREAFHLVQNHNLNITVHAGEAFGPASIHQALHYCGAHRIGHGVRLVEDPDLLDYVNNHRIPLEMCPTSNVQTKAVSSLDEHPLRRFLEMGLRVTVNTDNRLISATNSTKELWRAASHFQLSVEHVVELVVSGFKSAFLPLPEKVRLLEEVFSRLRALGIGYGHEISRRRRTAL